ncbi:MAG: PIN domain-containing protein [Ignavibacteriales bacterium]|nr:PIN domain-containing protein [Ignavibacteriales bacterium]
MIDKIFFDTNMIVYLFDLGEPNKRKKKVTKLLHKLVDNSRLFISSQVVNEFINYSTKKIENEITDEELKENLQF